ncbi:MAG: NTP transferase domain-containing protein, partial [Myxococcota bacterium]|nr:NTP transferase domain-containing protein [Myxococcota bacterium]
MKERTPGTVRVPAEPASPRAGLGVAIMAGGVGRRLAAVTGGGPKALAPFAARTLLDHQLARVAPLDPERIIVLGHHPARAVGAALGDRGEMRIEDRPLGTAGGLALLPDGPQRWLVVNVDHISDVDLLAFCGSFTPPALAATTEVPVVVDEGVVTLVGDRLTAWQERPVLRFPVTIGLYVFDAAALREHLDGTLIDMP